MSKKFLTDAIVRSTEMPAVAANRLAADIIDAIKGEIIGTGRFTLPDFGAFVVRETPKRTALNPRTGETGRCRPAILPRAATWYAKRAATFSDALAAVRRAIWADAALRTSAADRDPAKVPRAVLDRMTELACYAA